MCLYTRYVPNPKYKANKKNGGNIPPIRDPRMAWIPIACQDCMECRKKKARDWRVRLSEEIRVKQNAKFVTLTFSDEAFAKLAEEVKDKTIVKNKKEMSVSELGGYALDNAIATRAVRKFTELWRKHHGHTLRHWLVTELGHEGTKNIHLHGFVWTTNLHMVEHCWKQGFVWKGRKINGQIQNYVNGQTISYCVKYIFKMDKENRTYKPVILSSNGIGASYAKSYNATKNKYQPLKTNEAYTTSSGHKISLPIYLRNKIYTETERENLWIEKLDEQVRYVCGEKISIANDEKQYLEIRQFYRAKNAQLGYGTGFHSEEAKMHEKIRRQLMQQTRIARAKKVPPAGPTRTAG